MSARSTEPGSKTMAKTQTAPWRGKALDPEVLSMPGSRLPKIKVPHKEWRRAQAVERRPALDAASGLQSQLGCYQLGDPTNPFFMVMGTLTSCQDGLGY